ncbi:MAG: hypothetical protein IPO21_07100 [Bacteroidales bacterium]|nr:hypothetical protein [Bacteroidales bacterium]
MKDFKYDFVTDSFAVNSKEIHLLRNEEPYRIYKLETVSEIKIFYGKELKLWFVAMIIGLIMSGVGIYLLLQMVKQIFFNYTDAITLEHYIVTFPPLFVGLFLLYSSLRKTFVISIRTQGKELYLSLKDLIKNGQLEDFFKFVREHFSSKVKKMPVESTINLD